MQDLSPESTLLLLYYLIFPKTTKGKRVRAKNSYIKSLYALYNQIKHQKKRGREECFVSLGLLGSSGGCCKRSTKQFFSSEEFALFGHKKNRYKDTSIYQLHPQTTQVFQYLERWGMMKGFKADFRRWKKVFKSRMEGWLLPRIEAGLTLEQVCSKDKVAKKLSTENELKMPHPQPLKMPRITPLSEDLITPLGIRKNFDARARIPGVDLWFEIGMKMMMKGISEADALRFCRSYTANHHKKALDVLTLWENRGMEIKSPVRVYQTCLNRTRENVSQVRK